MSLPPLTVIPAGAGSGKTYTIQHRLGDWVARGLVAPERIVAVTFTEAAAGELRERIRGRLVELGRLDDALRLDEAWISTIHAFGQRLLTEFAFDHGASPTPRLLNDDEKNLLVRQAIAETDQVAGITSDLKRHGYNYQPGSERSAEDAFRDDILKLVGLLRAMGWVAADPAYARQAADSIAARYGAPGDGAALTRRLEEAVRALLAQFPASLAESCGNTKTALDDLRSNFSSLLDARKQGRLDDDWRLWAKLADLRTSNRRTKLPPGYDDLAAAVIAAAGELHCHPGPLAAAQAQATALVEAAQEVLVHYAETKRAAGLVDYDDMIALARQLLAHDPATLGVLRARVDCLVVDEFQDTNPLQFALLWELRRAGVPTLVVGDLKQAIMGFQSADARLFEALQHAHGDTLEPLTENWRSQPAVMEFVNALGARFFPATYLALTPRAPATALPPLEAIVFATRPKNGVHATRAAAVGARLKALLDDPSQEVVDRHAKMPRRLRGSDIAVLCRTHDVLTQYAEVFRGLGLAVQLEEGGWYGSSAVQIALAALAYVANPEDRHAALVLETTELGNRTLTEALEALMRGEPLDSPLLAGLRGLNALADHHTVYTLVAETLATLGLYDAVMHWPAARQQRANLLRLQAEAGEFMEAEPAALACGGFFGAGIPSFLAWLDAKLERDRRLDTQPTPSVLDEHAIELVTWHSAKGREWPVVVVAGLDRRVEARLPQTRLGYTDFADLARILAHAELEYSPAFDAPATRERFTAPLFESACEEERRLLYVAFTRAREKLVVEWPAFCAGSDSATVFTLIGEGGAVRVEDNAFVVGEASFPCLVHAAASEIPEAPAPAGASAPLVSFGRRALSPGEPPVTTADVVNASGLGGITNAAFAGYTAQYRYAPRLAIPAGRGGTEFGTALHRCFEVLGAKAGAVAWLPEILGVESSDDFVTSVANHVAAFEAWLAETWPSATIHREWPVLVERANGSVLSGTLDLLVLEGEDAWVIDHKSDLVTDTTEAARQYLEQLEAYAEALSARGCRVRGLALHWVRQGLVAFVEGAPSRSP